MKSSKVPNKEKKEGEGMERNGSKDSYEVIRLSNNDELPKFYAPLFCTLFV